MESVKKSTVRSQQKVKPDKIEARETKKSKKPKVEGLILPISKDEYKRGESSAAGAARKPGPTEFDLRDRLDHRRTTMLLDRGAMYARDTSSLQTQLTTTLGRIKILKARDPEPQEGLAGLASALSLYGMLSIIEHDADRSRNGDNINDSGTGGRRQALINRGIAAALAEHDADRSRNGDNINDSGTGGRRQVTTQQECTYTNFLKCQPMSFQGTEGVVGLTRWIEKMESIFQISNYIVTCQVKFASCTLQGSALTW
nr:hypothetical protein [Tanacetum cinerariifolium]